MKKAFTLVLSSIKLFVFFIVLLAFNLGCVFAVSTMTENHRAMLSMASISGHFTPAEGGYVLSEEGERQLEAAGALFAIIIGADGHVIFGYHKPGDVPDTFSRADIAAFSRWYLADYPVTTRIMGEDILVVGMPKNSAWKYHLTFSNETVGSFLYVVPLLVVFDIVMTFVVLRAAARAQMRKRERARTDWIAGLSHDIRTPLAIVLGHAAALKEAQDAQTAQRGQAIEKNVLRVKNLIRQLNMDSKLTTGSGKWHEERIRLVPAVREMACAVINQAEEDRYEFELELSDEMQDFSLNADRDLLQRLIENLLNNAMVHNPGGCRITLEIRREKRLRSRACLIVRDNGKGVSPDKLKSLNARPESDFLPEHGLGLRLVKRIARHYGWQVRFESDGSGFACKILM